MLERFFHQGRLHFTEEEIDKYTTLQKTKPTITFMNLDRPAIIPEINMHTKALIADFDCSDDIILELIFGEFSPTGKLPFELPSSMEAVEQQKEHVPYDSENHCTVLDMVWRMRAALRMNLKISFKRFIGLTIRLGI